MCVEDVPERLGKQSVYKKAKQVTKNYIIGGPGILPSLWFVFCQATLLDCHLSPPVFYQISFPNEDKLFS